MKRSGLKSKSADIGRTKIHYMIGGSGPAVILLHGFAETSRMWAPSLPTLAAKFTVVAPDLPGIGDSSIPTDGISMKRAAIHRAARGVRCPDRERQNYRLDRLLREIKESERKQ
jgi:pimeloyl-ACP methyl ester carboxylesterase